jgi:hypothetical protein
MLGLALAVPATWAQHKLTQRECALVFQRAEACKAVRIAGGKLIGEAWDLGNAPGEEKLLGYVALSPFQLDGKETRLCMGVDTAGAIAKIVIEGAGYIEVQFLAQFEGRKLGDSFEIAQRVDDLLFIPVMIKAMKGKIETSTAIAAAVEDMLSAVQPWLKPDSRS